MEIPRLASDSVVRGQLEDRRRRLVAAGAGQGAAGLQHLLEEVDRALERLDAGSYGLCDVCHDPIEDDRLMADPLVRLCVDHLTAAQRRDLEDDLGLAATIQAAFLPQLAMEHAGWQVHGCYRPAGPVSGDYIDLIRRSGSTDGFWFLVGDVSGKGVSASLMMAHLHALFRSLLVQDLSLEAVITRANRLFCETTRASSYATLVAGRADGHGNVEICNAGHCPPLVAQGSRIRALTTDGLPLGLFSTGEFTTRRLQLGDDDVILLYTDGLSEARDPAGGEYGDERTRSLLGRMRGRAAEVTTRACLEDLDRFQGGAGPTDDLTLMAIRRRPAT